MLPECARCSKAPPPLNIYAIGCILATGLQTPQNVTPAPIERDQAVPPERFYGAKRPRQEKSKIPQLEPQISPSQALRRARVQTKGPYEVCLLSIIIIVP